MKFLLDTNVLLRLVHLGHPQQVTSTAALQQLRRQQHQPRTVPQVLYEYWTVATRPAGVNGLGFTTEEAQSQLVQLKELFPPLRDERGILERWEELVRRHSVQGRTTHDARLVAAMLRHNVTHLLTFDDSDFARFTEITVVTPDAIVSESLSL